MSREIIIKTINVCIDVLRGNFGAGRGGEALKQRNDDINILESLITSDNSDLLQQLNIEVDKSYSTESGQVVRIEECCVISPERTKAYLIVYRAYVDERDVYFTSTGQGILAFSSLKGPYTPENLIAEVPHVIKPATADED